MKESIRMDWEELSEINISDIQRKAIREHITSCVGYLKEMLAQIDSLSVAKDGD